jgi:hypothetical protein
LARILVGFLGLIHVGHKVHEGESEDTVVWRGGFVFLRVEKFLELFGAKLRGEGGFFHHTNKVESGANLRDTSGRKLGPRWWRSLGVVPVRTRWRRRGWRRSGGKEQEVEGEVEGVEKKAGNEVGETGCEEWEAGVFVEESIALGRPLYLHSVQKPVKRYRRLD